MINNWDQIRCQAAISALQGLQEGGLKIAQLLEIDPPLIAKTAVALGNALVDELQKDEAKREVAKYKADFPNWTIEELFHDLLEDEGITNPYLEKAINGEI